MRRVFDAHGYGEIAHAGARVRGGADARRPGGGRPGLQAVRRAGQRARAALGHDDPDRARGRDPLRDRRAAAALLLRRARLPLRPPAARAGPRDAAGRDRAGRRARRRTGPPRRSTVLCARARRGRAGGLPDRARRRLAVPGAARRARRRRRRRARRILHELADARLRRARARGRGRCGSAPRRPRRCSRVPQRRGGAEVLDAAGQAADGLRARATTELPRRRSPSA